MTNSLPIRKFEKVSKYKDIKLPSRSTRFSAGYDIYSATDITIPSIWRVLNELTDQHVNPALVKFNQALIRNLVKPTRVPTGIKVQIPRDNVLYLYNRSSNPLKHGLVLANGVGVIDADYYNNKKNEGEIFGSFYNFSVQDYTIHQGDSIMQGVFSTYLLAENDNFVNNQRIGGFGSTDDD